MFVERAVETNMIAFRPALFLVSHTPFCRKHQQGPNFATYTNIRVLEATVCGLAYLMFQNCIRWNFVLAAPTIEMI